MDEYGFQIGDEREVLIEGKTEQEALIKLIHNYWELIDKAETIFLLGRVIEKKKASEINFDEKEE